VGGVGIVIEGLDVADAAIIILELTLNEKIGLVGGDKSRSSSLGSSLSNETWKYSPPDSPTDTCLAWNLTGGGLASVHLLRPYLDPDCQKGRLKATASRASRKLVHIPRRRRPPCRLADIGVERRRALAAITFRQA
jgi:hypothetical protein